MTAEQWARASGEARITQVAGDHVTQTHHHDHRHAHTHLHGPGSGPAPKALLGLPEAPAALFGREDAVEELVAVLGEAGPPVVVVAGLAGVGKSALAVSTAHRAVDLGLFGDRVFFLPLRGYAADGGTSGPQAVREMLRLLGVRDADVPTSPEARLALYRAELAAFARAGRRVLVVADDAGAVAQVRDLVPAGDAHRLLVTSRHRLVAPGFTARVLTLEELADRPAAGLLADTLLRARPDDPRPAREADALAAVARHCGRLPLALTVAGALLAGDPGLSVAELARQLADVRSRLEALTFDEDGVPVGVRAAFDLSYARLPADQARLFRLLTVNPGPDCRTEHAGLLSGAGPGVRPALAALARASLLTEQPVGSGRWRMHDLLRLYATERGEECARQDGREEATDAFLARLTSDTDAARTVLGVDGPAATGPGLPAVADALHWLDTERPLLTAAVGHAVATGRPAAAGELARLLAPYLKLYGHSQEAVVVTGHVLTAARRSGSAEEVGGALYNLGYTLVDVDRTEEAIDRLTEARALFREISHTVGEGKALNMLGAAYRRMRRFEEAREAHEAALRIFRAEGIRHAEGTALSSLAHCLEELGRVGEAADAYRASVALMRAVGDRHREASGLDHLGGALARAGRREESRAVREQALAILREVGNRSREAWVQAGIAGTLRDEGRGQEARCRYEEALTVFEGLGDRYGQGAVLGGLGSLHVAQGRPEEAREVLERACGLLAGGSSPGDEAVAVGALAGVLGLLGRTAEAAEAAGRAAELFAQAGDAEQEAACREAAAHWRAQTARPGRPRDGGRRGD
ncbi:tetratricopeptide repeat protein [Streptomyces sp. NPDC091201]|uniref:tetratricopeptide repeat protein n=1 Tax=Streptomyces sp. NPDC091201 TaxID=3155190 RepID=UPI0034474DB4